MLLFLDTEYTGYGQPEPKLISLAVVAEDGRQEFYVELSDTWAIDECTTFVTEQVLPLLTGPRMSLADARAALRAWFAEAPRAVRVACDSPTDWRFLLELLGTPLPENLADQYYDLRPLIDTSIYHSTVDAYYRRARRAHHALADAHAYRRGWLAWMDARKVSPR
ncbi:MULTISPECIES: 3'-5' exoribonuclease [pseudomallei group]|uniref:3'-5' exoribonuclease n=1 Tax=pseudomallei group TaxID=111527 RepID=UPI00053869B6|nr:MULTISPECIES: 3'-5' exoribonuclease [pseudomallei group]KGV01485.1 hypothetical protein X880_2448 [Burkholderia pseudomallei MSHR4032]KGW87960.1 hypothetical protein Y030_2037 [Burkholderia pseudomallei MSHR332]MCS3396902.1 3'-5' exoribonuclease [Burkholderia thailandensis]MUV27185.1 hypothetical protein [Burkholderia thailandensis]QIO10865.1 hypothetical protein G9462_01955 [Burkholderia thailandensis]